jgi:hypothetical protein
MTASGMGARALLLALSLAGCGKSRLDTRRPCEGGATLHQICGWNEQSQDYDRACVYYCSDFLCPAGAAVARQCAFNSATGAYDTACRVVCAADGGTR